MDFLLEHNWWFWLLGTVILAWGVSLFLIRHWTRKRLLDTLAREGLKADEVDIHLNYPGPEDRLALEIIRRYRRRILLKLLPDTQLNLGLLMEFCQDLVKDIAAVYHPDDERPELRASLADLVGLYNRVGARVAAWLDTLPLRPLKDVELRTVLQCHEWYQTFKPVLDFLKRHHLDKAARLAWAAKNALNPWYWGRQAAYTGGRELLQRLFLAKVANLVGEEAINLYSRRRRQDSLFKHYQLALQEMVNLALEDGALPSQAWNRLLHFILRANGLEDREKLALLHKLAYPRRQEVAGIRNLGEAEREEIYRWLKHWVKTSWPGPEQEERLARVQSRWKA